jgi:hypothetical protein
MKKCLHRTCGNLPVSEMTDIQNLIHLTFYLMKEIKNFNKHNLIDIFEMPEKL